MIWYFDQKALYLPLSSLSRSDRVWYVCERGSLPIVHLRLGSAQRRSPGVHSCVSSIRGRGPPLEMLRMQQRVEKRRNWSDGRSHSGLVGWQICQIFSSYFFFSFCIWSSPSTPIVLNWIFNLFKENRKNATSFCCVGNGVSRKKFIHLQSFDRLKRENFQSCFFLFYFFGNLF